jgi:hypothetical protein
MTNRREDLIEERVFWSQRFQGEVLDFRGKSAFTRFDCCEFVKCTFLIDDKTEQLAFTECAFKDCNIDRLHTSEERGLFARNNLFDRPLEERRLDFEYRLAKALSSRAEIRMKGKK